MCCTFTFCFKYPLHYSFVFINDQTIRKDAEDAYFGLLISHNNKTTNR